jgi:hypothetical protein
MSGTNTGSYGSVKKFDYFRVQQDKFLSQTVGGAITSILA